MTNKMKSVKELEDEIGRGNLEKGLAWLMKVKKVQVDNSTINFKSESWGSVEIDCFYEK